MNNQYDVLIIGAGPAGTTAASILAEKGRRVLILEKTKFPRYHIGESLIPFSYFTLERLGMIEKLKNSHFVKKYSVQFVSPRGRASLPFYFFKHFDHPASQTWQVKRSEFDQLLLDNAQEKGAEVLEEILVREHIEKDGANVGLLVRDRDGNDHEFFAPVTIDASGIDAFTVRRKGWRVPDKKLNKVAVWTYYKGAMRDEGYDEGATTVAYIPEKGWFWYIPLADDIVSVGVVAEPKYLYKDGRDPAVIFHREIENNSWIKEHISEGEHMGQYHTTGDYSYRSQYCAADGLLLTGDAFAFLDPIFSSGVFLALRGGEMAADAVQKALENQDYSAQQFAEYGQTLCDGIESMRKLVYAFYDQAFSFREFLNKYPDFHGNITDVLIGNVYEDFGPLFTAVAEFADVPQPLAHGKALVA